MKEMHQSHVCGIFLGRRPKTFGCFIRVICIALAHFIPWRRCHKKGLSSPSDAGDQLWCRATLNAASLGNRKGTREGNWRAKEKKKKKKVWKTPQLWPSWVAGAFGNASARAQRAREQADLPAINYIKNEKIRWKAPTSEFAEEEMEISTFPRQRAWEAMWEGKALEVILYVNIGENKVVIFSLI